MTNRRDPEPTELITIAEAAELLGVSLVTMRRWDASGKFKARRHPINSYRLYVRDEVMRLRRKIVQGHAAQGKTLDSRLTA